MILWFNVEEFGFYEEPILGFSGIKLIIRALTTVSCPTALACDMLTASRTVQNIVIKQFCGIMTAYAQLEPVSLVNIINCFMYRLNLNLCMFTLNIFTYCVLFIIITLHQE